MPYPVSHFSDSALWGDKTPHYFHKMQLLQVIRPDVVFVNVIRGVAVARSMQKHIGFQVIQNLGVDSWTSAAEVHEFLECPERDVSLTDYLTMWARQILRSRDEATRLRSEVIRRCILKISSHSQQTFCSLSANLQTWIRCSMARSAEGHCSFRPPHIGGQIAVEFQAWLKMYCILNGYTFATVS